MGGDVTSVRAYSHRLLREILRRDLMAFAQRCFDIVAPGVVYAHNWHLEVIAWHLDQCLAGATPRLFITLPPRHLKSILASVALPAFALGHDPTARIICVSYSGELAAKHARDCRAVMEHDFYRQVFPYTRLDPAKTAELEFATTARGFRLATSVGGTLTGRGGNLVIIDDPLKATDAMSEAHRRAANDWFRNTLFSRLDDKESDRIIVVMQRLHVDDLVGVLLRSNSGWAHLNLPAIAEIAERFDLGDGRVYTRQPGDALHPNRESCETLERIRHIMGLYEFSAQYQQSPMPPEGSLIKWAWFRFYDTQPGRQSGDRVIQSWDTASKASELTGYSVCTTWLQRGPHHFLLDVQRARVEFPALKKLVVDMTRRFGPDAVLIEDKASGTQLIQDLRADRALQPIPITPDRDKVTRAAAQSAKIEAGAVFLPRSAPWLDAFQTEILQFPNGRYDDQIDSLSQYLLWSTQRRTTDAPIVLVERQLVQEMNFNLGPPPVQLDL